jgi:hypothetical protein
MPLSEVRGTRPAVACETQNSRTVAHHPKLDASVCFRTTLLMAASLPVVAVALKLG